MGDWLRRRVLRWARVPAEPEPPAGDPSSIRVFQAAPQYFRYKLVVWALAQVWALAGLVIGAGIGVALFGDLIDGGAIGVLVVFFGALAWLTVLAQIPISYAALRLDWELRWYMLSDRSLRIREGILRVREKTMTFANIQQISVQQGPLQRLLGIADVEVRTAGGGSSGEQAGESMHRAYFRGVADAEAIRDTIRRRVEAYRDAGLGDAAAAILAGPGRAAAPPVASPASSPGSTRATVAALQAAREVLDEARGLRAAVTRG